MAGPPFSVQLAALPGPEYDRSALSVGIVHLGVGGFHRSHQAAYLHRLMDLGQAHDWAICGVGVLPADVAMRDALVAQDFLYTLTTKHADGTAETEVIGSIVQYLLAPDDPEAVIERMTDPAVRIVSLTVTEGGYQVDDTTGEFRPDHPDIAHDVAHPDQPRTHFGLVVEALRRRRDRGIAAFTVQSCDNLPGNGDIARRTYLAFATLRDPELADWMACQVAFPNSMVDRITPVTTDEDRALVERTTGVVDRWPVVAEPFTQWVVEDHFVLGRPALEQVGVQYVPDVVPYELMKLRLLNVGHQGLCYFAALAGIRLVHEACADDRIAQFLLAYMAQEGVPTLPPVPGVDLAAYQTDLLGRFRNPGVRDTVARLCAETSDRIPKWLVPVVRENLAAGRPVALSAAIIASWATYARGLDEAGEPVVIVDRHRDEIIAAAARQDSDPLAFLRQQAFFGSLVDEPRFTEPYLRARQLLAEHGALETVRHLVEPPGHT